MPLWWSSIFKIGVQVCICYYYYYWSIALTRVQYNLWLCIYSTKIFSRFIIRIHMIEGWWSMYSLFELGESAFLMSFNEFFFIIPWIIPSLVPCISSHHTIKNRLPKQLMAAASLFQTPNQLNYSLTNRLLIRQCFFPPYLIALVRSILISAS